MFRRRCSKFHLKVLLDLLVRSCFRGNSILKTAKLLTGHGQFLYFFIISSLQVSSCSGRCRWATWTAPAHARNIMKYQCSLYLPFWPWPVGIQGKAIPPLAGKNTCSQSCNALKGFQKSFSLFVESFGLVTVGRNGFFLPSICSRPWGSPFGWWYGKVERIERNGEIAAVTLIFPHFPTNSRWYRLRPRLANTWVEGWWKENSVQWNVNWITPYEGAPYFLLKSTLKLMANDIWQRFPGQMIELDQIKSGFNPV